ncbi:MAG: EAL domain-containing protein [Acidobacteriota bacterium]|nr:EAL domain-containing protein [Acidobacteriota bacterium]
MDDNVDIHNDFRKILGPSAKKSQSHLNSIEQQLFDDEDELDESRYEETVRIEYDLDFALQGEEAVSMVDEAYTRDQPYALVFMDVRMPPGIDGIETILRIWRKHPQVEVVICTAYSDYSFDGILEKLGSSDRLLFLTKPFDSIAVKQMAHSLTRKWNLAEQARLNVLLLEAEIAQRKQSEDKLQHLIHHDDLTGLANRNRLGTCIDEAIQVARENATRFSLFFIELDRFHDVIDTLGYQIGDKLILKIADRLQKVFSDKGTLFRLDESEFALLLPRITSLAGTNEVARTIQITFEPSFDLGELNIDVNPKLGIVIYPDHGCNRDMLMRHADITLLSARDCETGFMYFSERMNHYSPQRLTLLTELRQAIHCDELMLYFQPKVSMQNNKVMGVEALLRWPHPRLGFISPARFIPLAERCGLIKPLTAWVMEAAARQWSDWKKIGLDLAVSVNLTSHDLQDNSLPNRIDEILGSSNMPLNRLVLEITEKGVMNDPDQAIQLLSRIRDMGIRVSIDNFGKGYSSLAYLKKLPIGRIKVDRSFVTNIVGQANDTAIVKSMIDLGHNLGLQVVAEGVSSGDSFELLKELGCDYIQGRLVNDPVPSGELLLWFEETSWEVDRGVPSE